MSALAKVPQAVFETVFAFPPNRETLGGTAYLIVEQDAAGQPANLLVDCPALNDSHQAFIESYGGVHTLFITHRGGMAQVRLFQEIFQAQVVIQEQEAYLLPEVAEKTLFHHQATLSPTSRVFWTPGHSPGAACLYHSRYGGILFTGRHLLPDRYGNPVPLRLAKTFHWPRQLRYGQQLLEAFTPQNLSYLCPGASTGFLRGEKKIAQAYQRLQSIDWASLALAEPGL